MPYNLKKLLLKVDRNGLAGPLWQENFIEQDGVHLPAFDKLPRPMSSLTVPGIHEDLEPLAASICWIYSKTIADI